MIGARDASPPAERGPSGRTGSGAFTLIELLITISIIAVVIGLLVPALGLGMATARSFKCQLSERGVAFDFAIFADPQLHGNRGDDTARFGDRRFSIETFMESQYGVDEFWAHGASNLVTRPSDPSLDTMRCPEVKGGLTMRRNTPCRAGAVGPVQNISYGFNLRLAKAETLDPRGRPRAADVQLTSEILSKGRVPLLWDVNGEAAAAKGVPSIFSAPPLNSRGPFANNAYWFPGYRHTRKGNYAFVDGSVQSSGSPLTERGWDWAYQARP